MHAIGHRLWLRDQILAGLSAKQKERRKAVDIEWVENERNFMFEQVNHYRQLAGKPPLTMDKIVRVETMAMGHCDYSSKFALYCAELVLDGDPEP
jgi:hypothetical protein